MRRILAAALFLTALTWAAMAPVRAWSADTKTVFAFDREFPPYSFIHKQESVGFEIDVLKAALERRGFSLTMRPMADWDRVQAELASGVVHIVSGMTRNELREKLFIFPEVPTLTLDAHFFVTADSAWTNRYQLRTKQVTVKKGSLYQRLLEDMGGYVVAPRKTDQEALEALWLGQADAYFGPDKTAFHLIRTNEYADISALGQAQSQTRVYYALYKGQTELRDAVDKGLREMMADGRYDAIYRKWFVDELDQTAMLALIEAAKTDIPNAYAPHTGRPEGAALLTSAGRTYAGATVETGPQGQGLSALESALSKAAARGDTALRAAVVLDPRGRPRVPTADERGQIMEFGRGGVLVVLEPEPGRLDTWMIPRLLPYGQ